MTLSLDHVTGPHLVIAGIVSGIVALFVYFQRKGGNGYNFLDCLRDGDGRASIGKHLAWLAAVLAVWLIMVEGGKDATQAWPWVRDFLLIALGYRVATSGVAAIGSRPQAAPVQAGPQIGQQVVNMSDSETPVPTTRPASAITVPPPASITNRVHE